MATPMTRAAVLLATVRERGACRNTIPTNLFFPTEDWFPGQRPWTGVGPEVKALCARCPVREECLTWALDRPEEHGYWGGTTPNERDKLRRGISRRGCPVCAGLDLVALDGRQVCTGCGMSWRLRVPRAKRQVLANADDAA